MWNPHCSVWSNIWFPRFNNNNYIFGPRLESRCHIVMTLSVCRSTNLFSGDNFSLNRSVVFKFHFCDIHLSGKTPIDFFLVESLYLFTYG